MRQMIQKLWNDQSGALISVEWVFVATILVLGVTVGLVSVRNAVNSELSEASNAITALNQDYGFAGQRNSCGGAYTAGTAVRGDNASRSNISGVAACPVNPDDCPCN